MNDVVDIISNHNNWELIKNNWELINIIINGLGRKKVRT